MVDWMIFAKRLKVARIIAGLSQVKAAEKAGIARITIAKAESGMHMLRMDTVVLLANAYGVSIDWLCGLDGGKKNEC